ncbi:MAG: hypothetical protein JXR77_03065 [Lentisphaeria bacterium]|nr:hypothetical protein [Lentisphaeria bacterium]
MPVRVGPWSLPLCGMGLFALLHSLLACWQMAGLWLPAGSRNTADVGSGGDPLAGNTPPGRAWRGYAGTLLLPAIPILVAGALLPPNRGALATPPAGMAAPEPRQTPPSWVPVAHAMAWTDPGAGVPRRGWLAVGGFLLLAACGTAGVVCLAVRLGCRRGGPGTRPRFVVLFAAAVAGSVVLGLGACRSGSRLSSRRWLTWLDVVPIEGHPVRFQVETGFRLGGRPVNGIPGAAKPSSWSWVRGQDEPMPPAKGAAQCAAMRCVSVLGQVPAASVPRAGGRVVLGLDDRPRVADLSPPEGLAWSGWQVVFRRGNTYEPLGGSGVVAAGVHGMDPEASRLASLFDAPPPAVLAAALVPSAPGSAGADVHWLVQALAAVRELPSERTLTFRLSDVALRVTAGDLPARGSAMPAGYRLVPGSEAVLGLQAEPHEVRRDAEEVTEATLALRLRWVLGDGTPAERGETVLSIESPANEGVEEPAIGRLVHRPVASMGRDALAAEVLCWESGRGPEREVELPLPRSLAGVGTASVVLRFACSGGGPAVDITEVLVRVRLVRTSQGDAAP